MSASDDLRAYLAQLHARLLWRAVACGAAILGAIALGSTPALVLFANHYAFSAGSIRGSRLLLLLALATGAVAGLVIPLRKLTRAGVIRRAEARFPQFQERLRTFAQRDTGDPAAGVPVGAFGELLAADTLRVARTARPGSLVSMLALAGLFGCGAACVGVLAWLIRSGPGYMGYGAALLWSVPRSRPWYELRVAPGDTTLRRHADLLVTAGLTGLSTRDVRLHVKIGTAAWQEVAMQTQPQTAGFRYLLAGLPDRAEYYVEAGPLQSAHFTARVADVAQVRRIRVTYHFPAWTQMPDRTDEHGGDLRAVQGTRAELTVLTDQPLERGALVLDDGQTLPLLAAAGNAYHVTVPLDRDGAYHLTTVEEGRKPLRITGDYFIEAGAPSAPQVAIVRPGGDYRASPIEEVTITAQATDEFGLREFSLHYSVNGGPEQQINLLPRPGVRQARGGRVLSLESLQLVPGDVVSLYAQAADARAQSRSQMLFVEAEPYEREFSQSQQGGGGGGGGANDQMEISRREKEIIAGTWSQVDGLSAAARQAEQAKFLSDVQNTLHDQALSLSGRLQMRGLNEANEQFDGFQKEMNAAADAMTPAAARLAQSQWRAALPDEQKALQHLLRAEATFRQIQVAFGSAGGGGGGNGGRDLASLSDLELDTQKNQYETAQAASPQQQRAQQLDAALRRLDELARKQEALAQEHRTAADAAGERWQQEMLRRQAQELQQQLAQFGNSDQSGQSQDAQGATVRQAMNQLREAQEAMRRAVDQRDAAGARRAAQDLRDALAALGGLQRNAAAGRLEALARAAQQLAARARQQREQLNRLGRSGTGGPDSMIDARQQLADEVGRLEQAVRDAEGEAVRSNWDAAAKLRDALGDLDQADVQTRLQRSADLLRQGANPAGDASENDIPDSLGRLADAVRQAGQAAGTAPAPDEALSAVQRVRGRLAQLEGGGVGAVGGGTGGYVDGGWNTGSNPLAGGRAAPSAAGPAPADRERLFDQGVADLQGARRAVANDPVARQQVEELIRSMQQLDPRRFPGNPQVVAQLYGEVRSGLDRLELQLGHDPGDAGRSTVRNADSLPVPAGYEEAVAEYYRRLASRQ